jgi:hypothetical protein
MSERPQWKQCVLTNMLCQCLTVRRTRLRQRSLSMISLLLPRFPRSPTASRNRTRESNVIIVESTKPLFGVKSHTETMHITGNTPHNLCRADFSNACGLYYKSNGHFRETEGETRVIRSKKPRKPGDLHLAQSFRAGPVTANRNLSCANCRTNTTVLWRKGPDGQSPLCNPCGLFYKLHGTHRSPEKKKEIHRRNRTGKKRYSICTEKSSSWSSAEEGDDEESPSSGEFGYRRPSVGGSPQQQQPQHPQQQQHLQQQQQQSFVKMEGREFAPSQGVSHLPSFMGQPQYPYQWQGQSVQGRC